MIAGVDGCKDKWIAVVEMGDGRTQIRPPCTFRELCEDRELDLIVIDIPIGLADTGYRQADLETKRFLKHRHVCVFPAPTRLILDCSSREEACKRCVAVGDKRVNVFQWAILPKVKDIDSALRGTEYAQDRIREGHPEASFAVMNENTPLMSKKKEPGIHQRLKLLQNRFSDIRIGSSAPHLEDILDAYALLWTARRIQCGEERKFPEKPECDRFQIRMEILA